MIAELYPVYRGDSMFGIKPGAKYGCSWAAVAVIGAVVGGMILWRKQP